MPKLEVDNLCGVSNIATAAAISGEPFEIVSCAFYEKCNGHSKYVDPVTGSILDVTYCRLNPIFVGIFAGFLVFILILLTVVYLKYKGKIDEWTKPKLNDDLLSSSSSSSHRPSLFHFKRDRTRDPFYELD